MQKVGIRILIICTIALIIVLIGFCYILGINFQVLDKTGMVNKWVGSTIGNYKAIININDLDEEIYLTLRDDEKFMFKTSPYSDEITVGTYSKTKDKIVLNSKVIYGGTETNCYYNDESVLKIYELIDMGNNRLKYSDTNLSNNDIIFNIEEDNHFYNSENYVLEPISGKSTSNINEGWVWKKCDKK